MNFRLGFSRLLMISPLLWGFCFCSRPSKTPDDTLVIGIENEIKNLDLRTASDANSVHISKLILQGLVKIGDDLQIDLDLASKVTSIKDQEFRFKIPKGIRFHDGTPLDSSDVLYNFQQAAGPTSKMKSSFDDLESFSAPDAETFIIKLKKPRPSFLASDVSQVRIFPKHLGMSPQLAQRPIGSGPYRFVERRYRDLVFERFDGYKNQSANDPKSLPNFKHIIVRSVEDPTTRFFSLVGGDIDILINALSPRRITEAAKEKDLQIVRSPGSTYQYIGLNFKNKKLQDPRVRQALSLGIDREAIIKHKLKGFAESANSILSPQNYFHHSTLPKIIYDPERARHLLAEAGVKDLELEIRCSTDRDMVSTLQIIQEQWRQIGVQTRLKCTEFADFFAAVQKGQAEVYSLRWTAVSEPDILNRVFHSREFPPGRNRVFYSNPLVDRLLDQAATDTHRESRRKKYFEIQELISKDLPYISLWYPSNVAVSTTRLKGLKVNTLGSWMHLFYAKKGEIDDKS